MLGLPAAPTLLVAAAAGVTAAFAATGPGVVLQARHDIFTPSARFPCFRQPVLLATPNAVLAFAENRNVSACAPNAAAAVAAATTPNEVGSLQLRRSTDNGTTWSPLQSLFVGNIDFYTAVHDAATDTTWLLLEHETVDGRRDAAQADGRVARPRAGAGAAAGAAVEVLQSRDHGATWATLPPLSVSLPEPFEGGALKPSVGHGIQLRRPPAHPHDGRLVLPFVCTNTSAPRPSGDTGSCPGCNSCLLLSDDHGASWQLGAVGQSGSREASVVDVPERAQLYVSERNFGPTPGHRMFGTSDDDGATMASTGVDPSLVSPVTPHWTGIVASVTALDGSGAGSGGGGDPGRLVLASAADAAARANMTLFTSSTGGVGSWAAAATVWPGPAGYVDVVALDDARVALLFENGDNSFADRVSFQIVEML